MRKTTREGCTDTKNEKHPIERNESMVPSNGREVLDWSEGGIY